jgi:hypothetical protein
MTGNIAGEPVTVLLRSGHMIKVGHDSSTRTPSLAWSPCCALRRVVLGAQRKRRACNHHLLAYPSARG